MTANILLYSKQTFSMPDSVSTGIIGLFFGLLCGLFYYQHYLKPWYWGISLAGGLILTEVFHSLFLGTFTLDDSSAMRLTIASFAVPFLLTLGLNHWLYHLKKKKQRRRRVRRTDTHFFDINAINQPRSEQKKETSA